MKDFEKSQRAGQGLSIIACLLCEDNLDGGSFAREMYKGSVIEWLIEMADSHGMAGNDSVRARILDAIDMLGEAAYR